MKINVGVLFQATVPAILTFMLLDAAVEHIIFRISGISLLPIFEQIHQSIRFHLVNIVLFSAEMLLVQFFYAALRQLFTSKIKPLIISISFFEIFMGLFLAQMVNVGVYPIQKALIVGISTLIGFPVALFIGASIYEMLVYSAAKHSL